MEGEKTKETVEHVSYRRGRNLILQKAKMDSAEADIWRAIGVWCWCYARFEHMEERQQRWAGSRKLQ